MTGIFGLLGRDSGDNTFINTVGQEIVWEAVQNYVAQINADIQASLSLFSQGPTEIYTERYKLPGGGRMQRRAPGTRGGARRATGGWDVAYPIYDFDDQIAGDRVEVAYMTLNELQRHIDGIQIAYVNTLRFELLRRLFKNSTDTFTDPNNGSLTIQPLANGDTVLFPPTMGSESEATEDHYLESGYAASSINDTNNPYKTIYKDLVHHFGDRTGGANVAVFIHEDQETVTRALTDFVAYTPSGVVPGSNVDTLSGAPTNLPGKVIGKVSNCWVVVWEWMTTSYMLGIHLEEEAPLKMRVDLAATGLPQGLALVSNQVKSPFEASEWSARFGFGVANRLNGVIMELGTGGTYTIPTAYQ